jgi:hypothetical protein
LPCRPAKFEPKTKIIPKAYSANIRSARTGIILAHAAGLGYTRPMKQGRHTVAEKIVRDPIYTAIVKAVWWHTLPTAKVIDQLKDVIAQNGQPAVDAAAGDLLDYERHDGVFYARLKPELHVHCRILLGPMPSEWKDWWQNADGTDRKGKPKVWPPKLEGPPPPAPTPSRRGRSAKPSAGGSAATDVLDAQTVSKLTETMLGDRLDMARQRFNAYSPNSAVGRQASREIDLLTEEYRRRGLTIPVLRTGEEPKRGKAAAAGAAAEEIKLSEIPLRMLADRLHASRRQARTHASEEGKKAQAEVERIEAEHQRRG